VREITADQNSSLHVSIAGGRKTMGFYLGYALSLFGRAQDRLSHVLVSPQFETLPEFFYPSPHSRVVLNQTGQRLDAKDAEVHLGNIPFVRLREGLPESLLEGGASFSKAVAEAQKALPPLSLRLEPATQTVIAGGQPLVLEPIQFALYWMMAEKCKAGHGGVHWSERSIGDELLGYYGRLVGINSGLYEQAEKAYRAYGKGNFEPHKAHINRAFKRALGKRWASPYLIETLGLIAGTRYHRFGLSLPSEAITIAAASLPARHVRSAGAHTERAAPARNSR
jgi:CRISPR-associated protein NE0113 (Cas_NE0113)